MLHRLPHRLIHCRVCKRGHVGGHRYFKFCATCGAEIIDVHVWALLPFMAYASWRTRRRLRQIRRNAA